MRALTTVLLLVLFAQPVLSEPVFIDTIRGDRLASMQAAGATRNEILVVYREAAASFEKALQTGSPCLIACVPHPDGKGTEVLSAGYRNLLGQLELGEVALDAGLSDDAAVHFTKALKLVRGALDEANASATRPYRGVGPQRYLPWVERADISMPVSVVPILDRVRENLNILRVQSGSGWEGEGVTAQLAFELNLTEIKASRFY